MEKAPFFEIYSDFFKSIIGVKDNRSVLSRLKEIGAPIYSKGKNHYVVTEEVINALKSEDQKEETYKPQGKYSRL